MAARESVGPMGKQTAAAYTATVSVWIADVYEMEDDRTWKEKLLDKIYDLMFGWDCSPGWYRFAHYMELFIMDPFVDLLITLCIVGNTAFMACDHADISPHFANVLNIGNNVRHSQRRN